MSDNNIIGISGLQGCGKTALATSIAFDYFSNDIPVYCNYHLNFDYTPVDSLEDLQKVRNGLLILDEIWLYLFSRVSQSNLNKELMKIIMLNRKRNVDIVYTAQLRRTVDVLLRNVTNYFLSPKIIKKVAMVDGEEIVKYFISFVIQDTRGKFLKILETNISIDQIGELYNTREEIGLLGDKAVSPLEMGIGLEEDFVKAIRGLSGVNYVDLIPRSGIGSSWLYDVLVYTDSGVMAIDVKSAKSHVYINRFGKGLIAQINNAVKHGAKPFIAFPVLDRKRMTLRSSWFLYPLKNDSYLIRLRSNPRYEKLADHSILLKNYEVKK